MDYRALQALQQGREGRFAKAAQKLKADYLTRQAAQSVMAQPAADPYKFDNERPGGHALEAPMFAPDDLIGSGLGKGLLALGKGAAAMAPVLGGVVKPTQETLWALAEQAFISHKMDPSDRAVLSNWLRSQPEAHKDFYPGTHPTQLGKPIDPEVYRKRYGLETPAADQTWYHGGPVKLPLRPATFFTSDPRGATWFAQENAGPGGIGEIGLFGIDTKKPARTRDLFQLLVDEPSVARAWAREPYGGSDSMNLLDVMRAQQARESLKDRGFDSALVLDPLMSDEIPALVPVSTAQVTPIKRKLIIDQDHPKFNQVQTQPLDNWTHWITKDLPFRSAGR